MVNYNQEMRNMLFKHMEYYMDRGFTVYQSACEYEKVLYQLENSKNPFEQLYREYLICVMYLDAYKINSYKQKECIANDSEVDFLGQLIELEDSDSLLAEVSADPSFLVKLIEECYRFHEMNGLGKVNLVKSLDNYEKDWLKKKYPMHQQDIDTYDIKITLQQLLSNIRNQTMHQKNVGFIDFKEAIMMSITGFIRNLVKVDYENAMDLVIEIAVSDYVSAKTLEQKGKNSTLLLDHIDLYENYSRNEILRQLIDNQIFLMNAIWTIADVYVYGEFDGLSITEKEIDQSQGKVIMKKLV